MHVENDARPEHAIRRYAVATLSHGPRINARTTPEIHRAIKRLSVNASAHGLTFQGRAVSCEAIVSTVMLAFLNKPQDEQIKFLEKGFRLLETHLT